MVLKVSVAKKYRRMFFFLKKFFCILACSPKSGYRPDMKYKKNPSSSSFKDIFWLKHWKTQIIQIWQGFFGGPFSSSLSFWRLTKPAKFTACSNFQISSSLVFGEISPV
jgi:hypothetical protein